MKQRSFLLIAAIIPLLFGLVMMVVPDSMLSNSLTSEATLQTRSVTQWVGLGTFTIGLINFFSRTDPGSIALKAIMIGNIVFHTLGLFFDTYDYAIGVMRLSGLLTGLIPHSLLIIGFVYYLSKLPRRNTKWACSLTCPSLVSGHLLTFET